MIESWLDMCTLHHAPKHNKYTRVSFRNQHYSFCGKREVRGSLEVKWNTACFSVLVTNVIHTYISRRSILSPWPLSKTKCPKFKRDRWRRRLQLFPSLVHGKAVHKITFQSNQPPHLNVYISYNKLYKLKAKVILSKWFLNLKFSSFFR